MPAKRYQMASDYRCPKCGTWIAGGQTYCGNCKTNIAWSGSEPRLSFGDQLKTIIEGVAAIAFLVLLYYAWRFLGG